MFHAPGHFIRDGDKTKSGYNPGGRMHLYLHPQCAWHAVDIRKRQRHHPAKCNHCQEEIKEGFCIQTLLSSAAKRCSKSSTPPLFSHYQCTRDFVQRYRVLLDGYVGAQQRGEKVAWRKSGAMEKFCGQADKGKGIGGKGIADERKGIGGAPVLPADATAKQEYLDVFRTNGAAEEAAVVRHGALQRLIRSRIADDEAKGGKLTPTLTPSKAASKEKPASNGM